MLSHLPPREPKEIVREALRKQCIDALYVGFSGGKDSSVVAHFAATNFPELFKGCIFCDTGIKAKEALEFVESYCKEMDWPLFIVRPDRSFEQIVDENGFPGPDVHTFIMRYLKYIPMRKFITACYAEGEKPAILSGVRKAESVRRGINARDEVYKDGKMIFISPVIYKSDSWMYAYYTEHKLKRSGVYNTLHISGDCLCGCFSKPGEAKLLEIFHPDVARQISGLEKKIARGDCKKEALKHPTWGKQAGMVHAEEQDQIDKFLCNDCYFDRKDDSEEFLKEMDAIEKKLEQI